MEQILMIGRIISHGGTKPAVQRCWVILSLKYVKQMPSAGMMMI